MKAPLLAFWKPASSICPIAAPTAQPSSRAASIEPAAVVTAARGASQAEVLNHVVRLTGASSLIGKRRGYQKDGGWSSRHCPQ